MQTNNISCRSYETQNLDNTKEVPTRLIKTTCHEKRAEKTAERLLNQISEMIASKQSSCKEKTELTSNTENTSENITELAPSNDDGMTQLIKTQTPTNVASSASNLDKMLTADSSGNINEEQLQSALVQHLLEQKKSELGKSYLQELSNSIAQGNQFEDSVKNALKALVKQGVLTNAEAEKINGQSFRAAQLDNNLTALYDSKGGPNDNTIAVMKLEEAITKAKQVLGEIASGKLAVETRSLDAASNTVAASSNGQASSGTAGGDGFLWKPISDSNGKLAVLFPPNLTGEITSAGIYSKEPASYENLIEEGRYSGDGNGGRSHYRFSKPGGSYPDGVIVVARLKDGTQVSFKIQDSASRNT